jgi:photosystem II stability/assembly factor-like uncharacterized protein
VTVNGQGKLDNVSQEKFILEMKPLPRHQSADTAFENGSVIPLYHDTIVFRNDSLWYSLNTGLHVIQRTTNGGKSWERIFDYKVTKKLGRYGRLESFSIPSDSVLYVGARESTIFLSRDSGRTWTKTIFPKKTPDEEDGELQYMDAKDDDNCIVTYPIWTEHLARTRDGGKTWEYMDLDIPYHIDSFWVRSIKYTNEEISLPLSTPNGIRYYRSFDDGDTWEVVEEQFMPEGIVRIHSHSRDTLFSTLANRNYDFGQNLYEQICASYDGGKTWTYLLDHFVGGESWGIWRFNWDTEGRHMIATGDNNIFFTNNGGKTWRRERHDREGGSIGSWEIEKKLSPYTFIMTLDDRRFEMSLDSSLILVSVEEQQRADAFAMQVLPNIIERGQAPMFVFPALATTTPATVTLYDAQGRSYATSTITLHPHTETQFVLAGATAVLPAGQYYVIVEAGNVLFREGLVVR